MSKIKVNTFPKTILKSLLFTIALLANAALFSIPGAAQTTDQEKLSWLLLGGNYAVTNGYAPNGTHAGIDFGGTGTNVTEVRSPLNGTITANTTACGKIAIYDGVNTVIMAHMDSLNTTLPVGSTVKRGDYLGRAAQVVGGGCSASGPHLHVEVRTGNNPSMAVPTSDNRTTTINPVTMFKYNAWEFNTNSDFESWAAINVDTGFVQNGVFVIDPKGNDPYYISPYLSLNASQYKYVKIRMASNGLDSTGAIYFRTATSDYSDSNKVQFTVSNCSLCTNAPYYEYTLDMSTNSNWSGRITGIRIDPTGAGQAGTFNDALGIDYVRIQTAP